MISKLPGSEMPCFATRIDQQLKRQRQARKRPRRTATKLTTTIDDAHQWQLGVLAPPQVIARRVIQSVILLVVLVAAITSQIQPCECHQYSQPALPLPPLAPRRLPTELLMHMVPNSRPISYVMHDIPGRGGDILVPGNSQLRRQEMRVDQVIWPDEAWASSHESSSKNKKKDDFMQTSYVIDHKRFVEPYSSRCMATTLLEDPDAVEPDFVLIRPTSEVRVKATAPAVAIRAAGFDPRQRTVIFVHGFTQSYPETDWLRKVRALFEMHQLVGKQNFIIMDWGVGSKGSYAQVAARASGMGSFLANFLMKLIDDLGVDRSTIHLIGHSLGAHVAGFAGKRIRPRLGRITGLDAAGPCFGKFFSNSANDRLAPDDAYEVDVYHYDDGFLGLAGQLGQFDVYVNGGSSQPGATDNVNAMMQALVTMVFRRNRALSESHTRSTEVATSQLSLSGCQMVAYECRDWAAFLAGECGQCDQANQQCYGMDFFYQHQDREPGPLRQSKPGKRLFIATSPKDLYCLQHFQILVKFELSPEVVNQARKQKWRIHLELTNERNERSEIVVSNQLEPNVYSHLLLSEMQPFRFVKASLQVRQHDGTPVVMREKQKVAARPYAHPPRIQSVETNFMSHIDAQQRRRLSSRLCPAGWLEEQNTIEGSSSKSAADGSPDWLLLELC